jgi:hypothetical protein
MVQIHVGAPISSVELRVHSAEWFQSGFCTLHSSLCTCFASVPQQLQEEFCKLPFVGASPTGGSNLNYQDCGVISSISHCD